MRKLLLLGLFALPLTFCKSPSSGSAGPSASATAPVAATASAAPTDTSDAAASASATPDAATAPTAPAAAGLPPTTPVKDTPCHPGADTNGCGPLGLDYLTCSGGTWKVTQTCRGPGHCAGVGAAAHCSVGELTVGDVCIAANAPGHCLGPKQFVGCENGRWTRLECVGRQVCGPNAAGPGQPACR